MKAWTDEELKELENPDSWDWDTAELVKPSKRIGVRLAVRFTGAELEQVARAAEESGEKLLEFVKRASLEKAETSTMKRADGRPGGSATASKRRRRATASRPPRVVT